MRRSSARKELERTLYDELYAGSGETADPSVREVLLGGSEEAFDQLLARVVPGKRVLEIGCGLGRHALRAAELGAQVVGIDVSPVAVLGAEAEKLRRGMHAKFQIMDAERLDFPDASFDVVIDHEMLSSVELRRVLREVHRVLTPGGMLLGIETLGHNWLFNLNRRVNVWRNKQTPWAVRHVLRIEDLQWAENIFALRHMECLHFLVLFAAPFRRISFARRPIAWLDALDRAILALPGANRLAFKCVFALERPLFLETGRRN